MRHRVLIIDQSRELAQILGALLPRNSYEAEFVADPDQALSRLGQDVFDVVVSDVNPPEIDGFALGRRIRQDPATADIPIIYLTALSSLEDEFQGYLSGADAWITKPFRARDLLAKLDEVLHRASRPTSSGRLAAVRDAGRVIAAVTGPRARLIRAACRKAFCELEVVPQLDAAMSRADREKFDLLVCESQPTGDVQQQVGQFLDHFGLNLPVLFLLEHTQPLPGEAQRRRALRLPASVDEIAQALQAVLRETRMP